jgi:hypothetical protein
MPGAVTHEVTRVVVRRPEVSRSDGLTGMKQVRFGQIAVCLGQVLINRPAMSGLG